MGTRRSSVVQYLRELEKGFVKTVPKLGLNEISVEIAVVSPRMVTATAVAIEEGESNKVACKEEECSDGAGSFNHDEKEKGEPRQ